MILHGILSGQTYWSRSVPHNVYLQPIAPCLLPGGTLVLCGVDSLSDASLRDIVLIAMDTLGRLRWTQTVGTEFNDVPTQMIALTGGGVAVTGYAYIEDVAHQLHCDILSAGFTDTGTRIWCRRFAGFGDDEPVGMAARSDGGFFLAANSVSPEFENYFWFLVMNASGDTLFTKFLPNFSAYFLMPRRNDMVAYGFSTIGTGASATAEQRFVSFSATGDTLRTNKAFTGWTGHLQNWSHLSGDTLLLFAYDYYPNNTARLYKADPLLNTVEYAQWGGENPKESLNSFDLCLQGGKAFVSSQVFSTASSSINFQSCLLIDSSGRIMWRKNLDTMSIQPYGAVCAMDDSTYFVATKLPSPRGELLDDIVMYNLDRNGAVRWRRVYAGNPSCENLLLVQCGQDRMFLVATMTGGDGWHRPYSTRVTMVINDQYAKRGSLFTFKIPVPGDSLGFQYMPLSSPNGMGVSTGGTISWAPPSSADSLVMIKYRVSNGAGTTDTLSFVMHVSGAGTDARPGPSTVAPPVTIRSTVSGSELWLVAPAGPVRVEAFDVRGRMACAVSGVSNGAGRSVKLTDRAGRALPQGGYIIRMIAGGRQYAKNILVLF